MHTSASHCEKASGSSYLTSEPVELTPLVIVEGFLGGAGAVLWGSFQDYINLDCRVSREHRRRVIFARVGPVSSLHDRACELYYALIGGTVDYGEEHCRTHRHSRFGRTNSPGLYPEWSREKPLHFLGHSMGGPTIVKLQFLLDHGHFGHRGRGDMVRSINTISAPFRGTQLVYTLGEREDAPPAVRPLSIGSFIGKAAHLITFVSPVLPCVLDLHAESRSLSYREISPLSLLKQLWKSDWAESKDATPYDCTFQASDERDANSEGHTHDKTFYRSYVACSTKRTSKSSYEHSASLSCLSAPPLYISARIMGSFDYSTLAPPPSFLCSANQASGTADIELGIHPSASTSQLGEEYWANDGVCPLFSQWHPLECSSTKCLHHEPSSGATGCQDLIHVEPGIWYVHQVDDAHHMSLVPFWLGSNRQKEFWEGLGHWLRAIDARASSW